MSWRINSKASIYVLWILLLVVTQYLFALWGILSRYLQVGTFINVVYSNAFIFMSLLGLSSCSAVQVSRVEQERFVCTVTSSLISVNLTRSCACRTDCAGEAERPGATAALSSSRLCDIGDHHNLTSLRWASACSLCGLVPQLCLCFSEAVATADSVDCNYAYGGQN